MLVNLRQVRDCGLDGEGGLALAEEDVGGRGEGLAGGGADGHLHGRGEQFNYEQQL